MITPRGGRAQGEIGDYAHGAAAAGNTTRAAPHPAATDHTPSTPSAQGAPRSRIDLQGWGTMITALVGVATLGAGFAGGLFTQAQGGDARPQPTVTVTVPGPTVTVSKNVAAPGA